MANGENGQGIAIKMSNRAAAKNNVMVLNFALSVTSRFDIDEPMVITIIEMVINVI